jgi:hypothetical protein
MDSLDRKAAEIVSAFREKSITLLRENKSSMVSIYLLNQHLVPGLQLIEPAKNPELFYMVDSALYARYPGSDLVLDLHTFVAGLRKSVTVGRNPAGNRFRETSFRILRCQTPRRHYSPLFPEGTGGSG